MPPRDRDEHWDRDDHRNREPRRDGSYDRFSRGGEGQSGQGSGGVESSEYGGFGSTQSGGWADRQGAGQRFSGGVDTGYGAQGGSGGYGPMTQGSTYAQGGGGGWGRSGYGARGGERQTGASRDYGEFERMGYEAVEYGRDGRPGQGGGTYGQRDVGPASQRSQFREEQRSPQVDRPDDGRSFSEAARSGRGDVYDQHVVGGADQDHEPGYVHWRRSQLESHDRDYRRWRDQQARQYDEEYGRWRNDRHEGFSRDFHAWRSNQTASPGSASPPTGGIASAASGQRTGATPPLTVSTDPVESVTDGHAHTHDHQEGQSDKA